MATTVTRRAYSGVLTVVFVLAFSIGLFAQSRPATASSVARDLNSTLAELMRLAPATIQDLDLANQHLLSEAPSAFSGTCTGGSNTHPPLLGQCGASGTGGDDATVPLGQ